MTCFLCSKEYIMDPVKIPDQGFRVSCSRCGTKTTVFLPDRWRDFDKEGLQSSMDGLSSSPGVGGERYILIVDDTEFFRTMMADLLVSRGYRVKIAADGLEAMEMIQAAPDAFQLILLDLQMPRVSGFEVLEQLKEMDDSVPPVIVMTGVHDSHEDIQIVKKSGAAGFLDKSLDPSVAFDRIKMVLDQNQKKPG